MDATFIQQNQIIERYLMGKLPLKGAQDFERWCRQNPDTVARLGLSDRINSALRLLDAAGEPLPWTETPQAPWQRLPIFASVAGVGAVALVAALMLFVSGREKSSELARLEKSRAEQPLLPVQTTRQITMELSRSAPNSSRVHIGGTRTELADFRFDVSGSRHDFFVVTVNRVDQGLVAVLSNVARDSNGHVRLSLNSSALGPGDYTVQVEGLDLNRGTDSQGWARFAITR